VKPYGQAGQFSLNLEIESSRSLATTERSSAKPASSSIAESSSSVEAVISYDEAEVSCVIANILSIELII
jgi:hypothetical protein